MRDDKDRESNTPRDANRDPITGTPGSHPVGTGIGAAAGGAAGAGAAAAAGAATGTAVGGPIGTAVGAVVGAVAGGLAGKAIAEKVDPTAEDAYWRENYIREPYYERDYSYDDYQGAYRTGYEGYARWGATGKRYDELEPDLRREYERNYGTSRLNWEKARPAVRAAWQRFDRNLERYLGFDVIDRNNERIGELDCLWCDHRGEPAFVGVRTGWFMGKTHVVPSQSVQVGERGRRLRLPYDAAKVKDAPAYDPDVQMTEAMEREVYRYYGITTPSTRPITSATTAGTTTPATATRPRAEQEEARLQLSEEQLKIGKREVEAGGVRLRKIVRTEVVHQPVELRREEIVIERVPASEARAGNVTGAFQEEEIYVPLCREEAVVQKEARVREEVRAHKESRTDKQEIAESVRKEDVEIEKTGEAGQRFDPDKPGSVETIRQREQKPRSQRQRQP